MRVLMLPRYGRQGASSRVRMYQYIPALERAGMSVSVSPLFGDGYVRSLYAGRRSMTAILAAYMRRIGRQLWGGQHDVVWIEKELLPWMPRWTERLRGDPLVAVDYDDAVFHNYDRHRAPWIRRWLGDRIDRVMARADLVTAGNGYLAARAGQAGSRLVELLPTVVDLTRFPAFPDYGGPARPLRVGWIGSPATADYLKMAAPAVLRLAASQRIDAVAVGARPDQVAGTPFRAVPWTEATEASLVSSFDIGIMPLPDEPWERGKCGYKLIQYMACGVPVVASPVGVNCEIVAPGRNGLLVSDDEQWLASLQQLANDPGLRHEMGAVGRQRVEQWYSLQAQAPRLVDMLEELARKGR